MHELLIIWHSRTGGSAALADAARAAAEAEEGARVRMLHAGATRPADLLGAGGYLFACPENLAAMSGAMKEFFDRCYYPLLGAIEGRPYAAMICAGTDGSGALRQLERIATGWRLRRVIDPLLVVTGAQEPEAIMAPKAIRPDDLVLAAERGAKLAAGLAMGVF